MSFQKTMCRWSLILVPPQPPLATLGSDDSLPMAATGAAEYPLHLITYMIMGV